MHIQTSGYTPLWLLIICSDWYFVISFAGQNRGEKGKGKQAKRSKRSKPTAPGRRTLAFRITKALVPGISSKNLLQPSLNVRKNLQSHSYL